MREDNKKDIKQNYKFHKHNNNERVKRAGKVNINKRKKKKYHLKVL